MINVLRANELVSSKISTGHLKKLCDPLNYMGCATQMVDDVSIKPCRVAVRIVIKKTLVFTQAPLLCGRIKVKADGRNVVNEIVTCLL